MPNGDIVFSCNGTNRMEQWCGYEITISNVYSLEPVKKAHRGIWMKASVLSPEMQDMAL